MKANGVTVQIDDFNQCPSSLSRIGNKPGLHAPVIVASSITADTHGFQHAWRCEYCGEISVVVLVKVAP